MRTKEELGRAEEINEEDMNWNEEVKKMYGMGPYRKKRQDL